MHGTRLLLSISADIERVKDNPQNQTKQPRNGSREPGYYWSSSSLYWAVQSGNGETLDVLLAHLNRMKIEVPNIKLEPLERALHYAARSGHFSIMKVLLDIDSGTVRPSNYDRILSSAF
jgi:hypothetical protein